MPTGISAALAALGTTITAGVATGTAAAMVGGAVVGAVVGGVVSAVKGGNILKGALVGGLVGAAAGGLASLAAGSTTSLGTSSGTLGSTSAVNESLALTPTISGAGTGVDLGTTTGSTFAANEALALSPTVAGTGAGGATGGVGAGVAGTSSSIEKMMLAQSGMGLVSGLAKGYAEAESAEDQTEANKTTPVTASDGKPLFTVNSTDPDAQAMSYRNYYANNSIPQVTATKGATQQ